MGKKYVPELGQAAFGCPTSEYECPEFVEAGLRYLDLEIKRVWWNVHQVEWASAFGNNASQFNLNPYFHVRAYDWSMDGPDKPNFKFFNQKIADRIEKLRCHV